MIRNESKELEEHLSRQIVDIKDINGSNVRVKEVLEQQLIDHKDSIGKIYSITSKLDQQVPDEVLFDAVEMMEELMHTEDVAIYEGGEMQMILMLWGLSWKKMTLGQANFLTVVSYLIQNAVLRARRYMTALDETRYMGESEILA